jgi:CRISPR/Cas system-associated endonuclease/helicase Cas3
MAQGTGSGQGSDEVHYHLDLTPAQLKITHTALKSLLDDFGHEEHDVVRVIHEVLEKLPDEHSIRAIVLDEELRK